MDIKELLKESVSPEVSEQLQQGLTEAIQTVVAEKNMEIADLKEKAEAYGREVENHISEKADEYGAYLIERADKYGAYLIERAEAYGHYLQEQFAQKEADYVQQIADLKEKANEYGEYIKQELIEKADQYTAQFVQEYQAKNSNMFEAIQNEQRATDILETFKATLAMFGSSTDNYTNELKESLNEAKLEIKQLKDRLYENDIAKQKELIVEELTEGLSYSEQQAILTASKDILTESLDSFKNVVNVLVSRKQGEQRQSHNSLQEKINENVNNINNKNNVFDGIKNENNSTAFRLI